jgi:hypothetical protein
MQRNDLTGKKFGRWTVLSFHSFKNKHTLWNCECECGNTKIIEGSSLKRGGSLSCGCLRSEMLSNRLKKWRSERLKEIYRNIKNRCYNRNVPTYNNYGGRGIVVCKEWIESSLKFQEWSYKNGYTENLTIERVDTNKGYQPDNCRWATMKEQQNNRRDNIKIEHEGEIVTISELSAKTGILDKTLYLWNKNGNLKEKLITGVVKEKEYEKDGTKHTLRVWGALLDISPKLLRDRIQKGWTIESALQPKKTKWNRRPKK